ncbi:MAG: polymorphic toxin-type HINT domain-containing protein, partial [Cutibacterium avidum]|nr:polymorphic toxin-type HINT domain-containing protein [Cutibacterium avidum]
MPTLVQYGARSVVTEAGITGMVDGPDASWLPPQWSARDHGGNPMDPWAVATNVGVSAQGSLLVQGMEWMQARVYDPATRGFLSTDPLPGVAGAGWSGNPYAFAGNDPVNFSDPLGLRPLTDEDLKGYRDAARSPLAKAADAAGGWLKNNWEYVAGGAMVAAGGVLMATGVGGPLGGVLLGAGIDTIAQKATTGSVTWGEVAVSGAAGLVGGGLGAAAGKWAAGKAATCLGKNVVSGLTEGAIDGGIGQAGAYWAGPGPHTLRGGLKAVAVGAAGGGLVGGGAGALSTVTDVSRHGCFVAGTQVLMADGTSKNIEDVVAGDMVAAYNPETGQAEPGEVTDTYIHDQVATWQVATESGTVTTTAVHPFYVDGKGWVEAQDLRAGDQLYDETGSLVTVVSIQATGEIATVYNVTVKDLHNYYVADDSSWVLAHNGTATGCGLGGPGEWGPSKNHGSANARAYELQITGRPEGYYVNGVEFDGFQNGELLDAKGL